MSREEMLNNLIATFGFEAEPTVRFANMMKTSLTDRGLAHMYKLFMAEASYFLNEEDD